MKPIDQFHNHIRDAVVYGTKNSIMKALDTGANITFSINGYKWGILIREEVTIRLPPEPILRFKV